MTNRPSSVISSSVVPGISDHNGAVIELNIQPIRVTKTPRDIPLYKPLYGKMRKASRNVSTHDQAASLRTSFHRLKSHIQAETHKAYWNFIATVILPQGGSGTLTKSFWSFLRWNRTEKMSISALKSPTTGNLVNNAVGKAEILNSL